MGTKHIKVAILFSRPLRHIMHTKKKCMREKHSAINAERTQTHMCEPRQNFIFIHG